MRSSQMKMVAVFAVIIIVAAAVAVYFYTKQDKKADDTTYRYEYNYTYKDVDSITLNSGETKTKDSGAECIRVYTITFENKYSNSISLSYSTIHMKTTVTHPKDSSAEKQEFNAEYISSFFSTSSSCTVYAGTSATIQLAYMLKDYSSYKTEKSEISVDLSFSDTINSNSKKVDSISVPSTPVQFRTNPTTSTTDYKAVSEITLKDGTTKTAKDGYEYRIYAINVRSMGDAITFDPTTAVLNLNVTYKDGDTTTTKGYAATPEKDYKLTETVSLDKWSDNTTACKTVYLAFLCPKVSSTVSEISTMVYLFFTGYVAGLVTNNSGLPSPALPTDY